MTNFGKSEIYGDICKIDPVDVPNHDLLLAGFPCQPFSQAGLRHGFKDTRGTLFFNIEQIIKYKRPQAFLLENVKHLKGHDINSMNYKLFILHSKNWVIKYIMRY